MILFTYIKIIYLGLMLENHSFSAMINWNNNKQMGQNTIFSIKRKTMLFSPVFRLARAQKGLQDVLFSKIGKSQRDPAIMLVASVIEVSDFVWCLTEDKETQEKGKFFLIVVNLVTFSLVRRFLKQFQN